MRKWPFFHRRWEPRSPWSRSRQLPGPTAGQPAPADWPEPAANWQYQHIWLLFLKIWATTGLNLKKYEANMVILPSCLGIYSGADFEVKLRWEPVFHLLTACTNRVIEVKLTKWQYLSHLTSYQENKDTLFSSTLKVEENKVPLFSW